MSLVLPSEGLIMTPTPIPGASSPMKAVVLKGPMKLEVRQVPVPQLPEGGALVRVESVGLCGSDISRIRFTKSSEERILGHEVAGEIVALSSDSAIFQVGERVAIGHVHVPCGHCLYCRHGTPAMCRQFKQTRITPGGYAQYVAVTEDHLAHTVLRLPDDLSYEKATFVDPVACCLRAIHHGEVRQFDRVVILGAGIMGLIMIRLMAAAGAEVIALDIFESRLKMARSYGAAHALDGGDPAIISKILDLTDAAGADCAILTFLNQASLDSATEMVRDGGRLMIFAPPAGESEDTRLMLDFFGFFRRELRLLSSYSSSGEDLEVALQWISSGRLDVGRMITGHTNLDGLMDAVAGLDESQYKIIVTPHE